MSFNIRAIREVSNDPLTKFTNDIAKKLSLFLTKQEVDKLENKEDIYSDGQDLETVIRFHDELEWTNKFDGSTTYYPPIEPDGENLRMWIRGHNLGNTVRDFSCWGHGIVPQLKGDPLLIDGTPFDDGLHVGQGGVKSTCLRFNRPGSDTENDDYISIGHDFFLRVSEGLDTGISFFMRFRIHNLLTESGVQRTLFEKIDNTGITDGVEIRVDPSGRLKFHVKNSNVEYNKETATGAITTNTVYDLWCTYTKAGNVQHIYINNVDKSLSTSDSPTWRANHNNYDATLFGIGDADAGGSVYGDLYDFRIYREKIVSAAEVGYMYTNKWTIANIPFGQVMISNYWSTYDENADLSYTSTSFTTTSFTQ